MPRRLSPLQGGVPLRRSRLKPRSAKRAHEQRLWAHLRVQVFARDGRCVRCGAVLHAAAWECHHRQLRSAGGPDALHNLVALCGDCHRWAHANRLLSEPLGLIVPSHTDPASVAVTYHDGSVRLLTEREAA